MIGLSGIHIWTFEKAKEYLLGGEKWGSLDEKLELLGVVGGGGTEVGGCNVGAGGGKGGANIPWWPAPTDVPALALSNGDGVLEETNGLVRGGKELEDELSSRFGVMDLEEALLMWAGDLLEGGSK